MRQVSPGRLVSSKRDRRGVSPVIGVILMVAISVTLAAVIGTYVLEFGGTVQERGPQVSLTVGDHPDDFSSPGAAFTIAHEGGDALVLGDLELQIRTAAENDLVMSWDGEGFSVGDGQVLLDGEETTATSIFTTGGRLVIEDTGESDIEPEMSYRILIIDRTSSTPIIEAMVTVA